MKKILLLCFGLVIMGNGKGLLAQNTKTITLHFAPIINNTSLTLGQDYPIASEKNPITFTGFKCYVSHFAFCKEQQVVYLEPTEAYLLDYSDARSLTRTIVLPSAIEFDEIKFYLGIDDKTNDIGISGGDLDPTKGMYWTWQTGYINMKLEGNCKSIPLADHTFQFHLGGFIAPFSSFQTITLKTPYKSDCTVAIELNAFISKINLAETHTIMSPGEQAVTLSKYAATMFHLL